MSTLPTPGPIATTTTRLRHVVRLLHASTGTPLGPVRGRLDPHPHGWAVRPVTGGLVVTSRDGVPPPAAEPVLEVTLDDARWGAVLDLPGRTTEVDLDGADEVVDVAVDPVPMTLVAHLTTPSTGAPRTGRTVVARATSGPTPRPTVALAEGDPGTYTSAAVVWTTALTPCELLVNGSPLRTLSMDFTSTATSIRLVDTT